MQRSDFQFSYPLRVRYSEVDVQGVVFNAHYLTYFDVGITEYFRTIGFQYVNTIEETGEDFHLVKSTVEYKTPIRFDQEIEVCVRAGRIGTKSIQWVIAIFDKSGEKLLSSGEVIYVSADLATHQSIPLPQKLLDCIESTFGLQEA